MYIEEVEEISQLKADGYPVVARKSAGSLGSSTVSIRVYVAKLNKAKEPKVMWSVAWQSEPVAIHLADAILDRVKALYGIPEHEAQGRRMVAPDREGKHCQIVAACVRILSGKRHHKGSLPIRPRKLREMPDLILMDETAIKRIKKWAKL